MNPSHYTSNITAFYISKKIESRTATGLTNKSQNNKNIMLQTDLASYDW